MSAPTTDTTERPEVGVLLILEEPAHGPLEHSTTGGGQPPEPPVPARRRRRQGGDGIAPILWSLLLIAIGAFYLLLGTREAVKALEEREH